MSQNRRLVLLVPVLLAATALAGPAAADHVEQLFVSIDNRLPSTAERIGVTVSGYSNGCPVQFADPVVTGRTVRLEGATIVTILPCPPGVWSESLTLQPLAAGGYTVEVWIDGALHRVEGFAVREEGEHLLFADESFSYSATVTWKNPYGPGEGVGHAIQLGDDSGAFWFFAPGNVEVTLKLLDGTAVNGHQWVFIASMTTVEFTVTVSRCPISPLLGLPCQTKSYRNPPLQNRNFLDTRAF